MKKVIALLFSITLSIFTIFLIIGFLVLLFWKELAVLFLIGKIV